MQVLKGKEKEKKLDVSIDKLIMLYCNLNNGLHGKTRRTIWDFLFGNKTKDDDIEDYFANLKSQVVDIIDSGLITRSELVREITPFNVKSDDVKKYLKL